MSVRESDDHTMDIEVRKIGGIWHGTIKGHPEIDVRALTEEIARRKITDEAKKLGLTIRHREPSSK